MLDQKTILSIKNDEFMSSPNQKMCDSTRRHLIKSSKFLKYIVINKSLRHQNHVPIHNKNLTIIPTNSKHRILFALDAFLIGRKVIKQNQIDAITTQDPYECGLSGYLLKLFYKVPLNLQIRTDILDNKDYIKEKFAYRIFHLIAKVLIRLTDTVGTPSIEQNTALEKRGIHKDKIFLIPTLIDLETFKNAKKISLQNIYKLNQSAKIIIFVGRLTPQKNLHYLIESFQHIHMKYNDLYLLIVGSGKEEASLKEHIKTQNIKNTILTGRISYDDIPSYYASSNLFIMTSKYEGASKSLQEASASGIPVISTNVTGANQIIINNKTGFIVNSSNELIEQAISILNDPTLGNDLGHKGQDHVLKAFSEESKLINYLQMFEKTIECKK